jgi:hypothetical protein
MSQELLPLHFDNDEIACHVPQRKDDSRLYRTAGGLLSLNRPQGGSERREGRAMNEEILNDQDSAVRALIAKQLKELRSDCALKRLHVINA